MEENIKKKEYICVTKSLCYAEEINMTLNINYTLIKFLKNKVIIILKVLDVSGCQLCTLSVVVSPSTLTAVSSRMGDEGLPWWSSA